jgi:molybdate transport system substrate-binding protein
MFGLSRLGLKTLIVACATASVAFPQAGFAQQPATPPVTKTTVTTTAPVVFAAASMETALDAIAASWTVQSGTSPSIVYASSAVLAKQIEQGAPADIFISADTNWMDYLDIKKLIQPGTRHDLLGNVLVLVEPANSRVILKIEPGFDLVGATGDGKIAVCIIESCPGGIYAKQALEKLGIWQKVEPKLAQVDNVRAALNLVSRGEAFGIVYATDAKSQSKVKVVDTFPESTHSPIIYPVAIVRTSKNPNAAAFLAFLSSQKAIKILTEQGFTILSN